MRASQVHKAALLCRNKLVVKEDKHRRMTPSVFTQEMLQSTDERLNNTIQVHPPRILEQLHPSNTAQHKLSSVQMDQPLFQPYPSELIFQNYLPSQTYKLPLLLLNNDKVSQQVKLEQQDSEQFHVVGPEEGVSKVAPGMFTTFTVIFTPKENKDYNHRLVCVTERERFEIPIHAIGPRAILDFRDEICLPVCAVKSSTQKTHLVRNIGNSKAKFKLYTERPFSVTPSSGTLDVGESMQVTVDFHPMSIGDHSQDLLLHYHTGEDVYINLYGSSEELNIHLETDCVVLKKTYVTLANAHIVSLTNRNDIPLQYCWTEWPSQQEEHQSLLRESIVIQQGEEEEKGQGLFQREPDPTVIHHPSLPSRAQQECKPAKEYLSLSSITVEPAEGEIWPNTTAKFHIVFKPEEAKLYQYNIYCDITGCESRLPLTIKGEGLGPQLELNYHQMDMKNVFIGDKDIYEVQMSNTGLIDAPFRFSSPDTTFGHCFSFSPEEGVVPPGACQIVEVTFHSHILGTFSEDLLLTVTGQPQPLTLTFRGCVIGPTFHFNVYELDFGDVAFGFAATSSCTLFNTSYVPMTFALHILGDGLGSPSVSSAKQVSDLSCKNWQGAAARDLHKQPVEFTVSPAVGTVRAMSDETIKVTLCSNKVGRYRLAMAVDVEGVGEEIMTLPINARCVVPKIMVEPSVLNFQRCFLGHTYKQHVELTNPSNLPACYGLLDQESEANPSLVYGSSVPRGVLLPGDSVELPVSLVAKTVGKLQHNMHIAVFGSPQQPLEVVLSCFGQGPVVHVQNTQLNFGQIPVLVDIYRTLHLINQSPIPAHFTTCMSQRRSSWRVEPGEGKVPPESQLELKVVAHLKDTLHFQDELAVSIQDSQTHIVSVSAIGTGTTIVSDRPLGPSLDLGTHFSHSSCHYCFKLTNHGKRVHRLYWKIDGFLSSTTKPKGGSLSGRTVLPPISTSRQKDTLRRGSLPPSSRVKPAFHLSPSRIELPPGSSVDMVLTASSDSPKVVHERLVCHGIIGPQGCQETIMSVDVTCRFVTPVLSISSKQLNFYIEKGKGEILVPQYEKLILKNESSLSLSMELSLVEPFFMCEALGDHVSATTKSIVLDDRSKTELWVCFDPAFYQDRVSRIVDELLEIRYLGHTQKDFVKLHAEVHYPNLHFSSSVVDFGCVFNYTETQKVITITNCSLLPVSYRWSFLVDHKHPDIRDTKIVGIEIDQMNVESHTEEWAHPSTTLSPAFSLPPSLKPDANEQSCSPRLMHVEEVFDILPMYGLLQPGDQQLITFLFFGHENVSREVVAQCHVEGGPLYEIKLRGEASVISYSLEPTRLDFGLQLFYSVREVEATLRNTGKVGFKFSIVYPQKEEEKLGEEEGVQIMALEKNGQPPDEKEQGVNDDGQNVRPGWPMVIPAMGYIDAGSEQCLRVLYLPGIPEVFEKHFQLQVAFLPLQEITLTGVGVFPRISLNLPRYLDNCCSDMVQLANAAVEADRVKQMLMDGVTAGGRATTEATCLLMYEELLHLEIERLLVKENALAVSGNLLEQSDSQWHKLSKFKLPEYVLDFGFVIPCKVTSKTVNIINSGSIPVSFHANYKHLAGTGFTVELEKVKNLPCGETQSLKITFDPRGANLKMGDKSIVLLIQVAGGPVVQVRLCAMVTMPVITVSKDTVQFDTVQCGMCQIKTIQLLNHESVPCYWSIAEEVKPFKKVDKFLPLYERKKILQEQRPPAVVFEMVPCSGVLFPGERVNVHIKFSPDKGCAYSRRLEVCVADNTQKVFITAQGHGEEPQLEFCPSVLVLGPCLPLNTETEAEVTVKNPCSFPIEFFSLEFDTQYLKEEKILRLMQGYDDNNMLLLPPRVPGEGLPTELLDYYNDSCSKLKDDELNVGLDNSEVKKDDTQEEDRKSNQDDIHINISKKSVKQAEIFVSELTKEACSGRLGELELTPVFRAIARHMGFDLSPEGLAARNGRGIAIIVYGAPLTDKSSTAASLAGYYRAACLSVDTVVTDALQNGCSPVSLSAKQLYHTAAAEYAQKRAADAAQAGEDTKDPGPAAPLQALDPNSVLAPVDSVDVPANCKESSRREDDATSNLETENRHNFCLGDVPSLCNLLPEPLLVDILAERFQLSDCHLGVVIEDLESVYTQCASNTLQVVLKALSNRKHIYVVNLSDSYAALKARERVQREAEEALQRETADREEKGLQDLDDNGYDAMSAEEKAHVIQWHLETRRQQKLRELEQMEKEQEQKRQEEEEAKRLKEEDLKKKNKKGGKKDTKEASKKENSLEGKHTTLNAQRMSVGSNSKELLMDSREPYHLNEAHHGKKADDAHNPPEESKTLIAESSQTTDRLEKEKCIVDELQCKFNKYEQNLVHVEHILQHWDRAQGVLLVPFPNEEPLPWSEDASTEKQPQSPAVKKNKKGNTKTFSPLPSETAASIETIHQSGCMVSPPDIIPHVVLNLTDRDSGSPTVLLSHSPLPPLDEVLDDLGLGPSGPPIPPPITFSFVSFPTPREQASAQQTCFTFLEPPGLDEDKEKGFAEDMQESFSKKESAMTLSKSQVKGRSKEIAVSKEKEKKGKDSQKSRARTSSKTENKIINGPRTPLHTSSTSDDTDQDPHQRNLEMKRSQSLTTFRWVVPANGEVALKIWFFSESPGKFEQVFNFELADNRKLYQLTCRGICTYPSICKDYMTLFAHSKKVTQMKEKAQKSYVIKPGFLEFGPLLCSKTRDRYKESRYPENTEKLVMHNNSGLEAEVQFSFQHDTQATTYLLDPPTMTLTPDQKQELTLWAYPTKQGQIKDCVICHIKDNPEPVIINLSCWGVRPEIELESRHMIFGRVLLHRRDSRSVTMHNRTALPVSWRLRGVEELGDEFMVPKDQDIIPPYSSLPFSMIFRPTKPLHVKKILRFEVSDVGKILGIVQSENVQVVAEAYDIDLEITPDGILNFGTIRVFEEAKLSLKLKNKGKYDLAFKISLKQADPPLPNVDSIFTVSPQKGSLLPHDKPTTVFIICRPDREVTIKEQPILPCQVIEPNIGKEGETIATLNIKVSVQSVFSRYKITPACDINFGPLVCGSKKSQSFTIENTGVFELCFDISCMNPDRCQQTRPGGLGKTAPKENLSAKATSSSLKNKRETLQRESSIQQNRFNMGVFSVFPFSGSLQPGSRQLVTVDCVADQLGIWNQSLLIDLSGCNPLDHPDGIPYRLLAEVCKPGIELDMASIFEEHHLCHNRRQLSSEQFYHAESIFVLDENKFIFNKVLVGRTSQARFRLTNKSKVPCVLNLAIKYVGAKTSRNVEVFDLSATTISISSQSHAFAIVTFTPQVMQQYNAVFEATMEGLDRMTPTFKNKVLEFDLIGEGTLPSVCVVRPALRSSGGSPMLMFRRVLVGRRYTLPLVLLNDGNVPAEVQIDMLDKHGVFALKGVSGNTYSSIYTTQLNDPAASEHQLVHRATVTLNNNEPGKFEVIFSSDKPLSVKANISVQVKDNQYSNATIQVTGEAYQEIITLDNISRSLQEVDQEDEREGNYEVLHFGDCHVDCPYQERFTMTNHNSNQVVRFEWPPNEPHIVFSPQVGHLHAGCSKEVAITFRSSQPVTMTSQSMKCKVCQVEFQQPIEQVADWDDRQRTVQWQSLSKNVDVEASQQPLTDKVITTDPEPSCTVVDGSEWELDLRVNANCDYVKFSCSTNTIQFKDTMLFQTRLHQLQIVNVGSVKVEFSWQVFMDSSSCNVHRDKGDGTFTPRPGSRSTGPLQGARPSSALASVMCLLMGNAEQPPFTVEPSSGIIDPGVTQTFSVCFSPVEVALFEGRLICSIPNLPDGDHAPCIPISGCSLLPHCHFDLEDSDYISSNRRNPQFRNPLDPNTRVLEFTAVGLSVLSTRCFGVVNPTSKAHSFKWSFEGKSAGHFRCLTPCGTIQPGKKVEMSFEYLPEQQDTVESLWSFMIETLSLTVPFLLVGTAREPIVYLDRPHLNFGELLVGHKVEQTVDLVNGEEEPVHFSVMQLSLLSEEQQSSLILKPESGTVAPKERLSLSVSFTPTMEGHVSFRPNLKVKRKSEPLTLAIKADCFAMSALVQVEEPNRGLRDIPSDHQDTLDFEKVGISETSTINLLVSNLARFILEVNFELTGPKELLQHLEAKPQTATIEVGNQLHWSLFFSPTSICNLQDVKLNVKVKLGPTFTLSIKGRAVAPNLEFSFNKFNFGKCFLCSPGMEPPSQTLVISNKGKQDISIHCHFKNTKFLEVDFQPDVLSPGAAIKVPVTFYPREACRYHEKLTFILNSSITKQVDILGQGIELKLEVEDPRQKQVKLGSLTLGQKVKKQVVLVNHSSVDISFTLVYSTNTPLDPKDLSISPAGQLKLKSSGGSCKVEIQFSPRQYISPFTTELQAAIAGFLHPLLTIQGCCQGVEVQLDPNHLSLGAVVQRCQTRKKIVMKNAGDIGARFHWKTEHFPAELSITPTKGYISPGMEIPFEVTFAPLELSNDIRYENLSCFVEGSSSAVMLTVTGSCITASTSKEVMNFTCPVRSSHTQTLSVLNPTNQHCSIRPVIEGEQWKTEVFVTFEPNQNKTFNITYQPLTMTADGKKHQGSVFFSFPDGKGMFYSLQGTAVPPKAEDNIIHDLPAKTHHSELLPVNNWLSRHQRFHVLIEMLKPDKPDAMVSLKGLKHIDVPALAKKDFNFSFFAYKEGLYQTKVTFLNEVTGEYFFYLITFKVTSPGVLSTIELVTSVRRTASATIQVENPLTTAICFTTECKCPDISAPPQHTVPGQSMGVLSFEYHPLQEGKSTTRLSLISNDLGHFHYDLLLKALPSPPEKTVHFNASLGSNHSILVKFINYSRFKTEYSCKTDCPDFIVDKSVGASPGFSSGSEASVEVCFEPHQLGEVRGELRLSSGHGGEYVFPLHGVCLPPKAQGPFSIKAGRSMNIPFKNVFLQTTTFSCQVDNPCFTVKGVDSILSKKTQNILVSFEPPLEESPGPWFGKLTVSSQRSEGNNKLCTWMYYLKGHRPESS